MFTRTKHSLSAFTATALVCITAFALTAALAAAGPVTEAKAATLQGKAYSGDTNEGVSGADVYLYRYSHRQGSWTALGRQATTNSRGYYTASVAGGYYYYARATKVYTTGGCAPYGRTIRLGGTSQSVRVPAQSTRTASLRMYIDFNC